MLGSLPTSHMAAKETHSILHWQVVVFFNLFACPIALKAQAANSCLHAILTSKAPSWMAYSKLLGQNGWLMYEPKIIRFST